MKKSCPNCNKELKIQNHNDCPNCGISLTNLKTNNIVKLLKEESKGGK